MAQTYANPELAPILSTKFEVRLHSMGGSSVGVWGDDKGHYYVEPFVAPDWDAFSKEITTNCQSSVGADLRTAHLPLTFFSPEISYEAVRQLSFADKPPRAPTIHLYPFVYVTVSTGGLMADDAVPATHRYRLPEGAEAITVGTTLATNSTWFDSRSVPITDSCDTLHSIHKNMDIQAYMYTPWETRQVNSYDVAVREFIRHEAFVALRTDEKALGSKRAVYKSKNGSAGFNLSGNLFGGGSKGQSTAETVDDRRRFISASLIKDAATQAAGSISIQMTRRFESPMTTQQVIDLIMRAIEHWSVPTTAVFVTEQGETRMKVGTFEHVLDRSEVDELVDTSEKPQLKGSAANSFKLDGVEASATKDTTLTDERQIKWQRKGTDWVPVSADLLMTSFDSLDNEYLATFRDVIAKEQQGLQARSLRVFKVARPEYQIAKMEGADEATRAWKGPEKLILPLPANLLEKDGRNFGQAIFCVDAEAAMKRANAIAKDGSRPASRKAFTDMVGCTTKRPRPEDPPAIAFIESHACFVSAAWRQWYYALLENAGALGHPTDSCLPVGSTRPYDG